MTRPYRSSPVAVTWAVALMASFAASAPAATITSLARFNGTNGANPYSGVIADAAGNLYGTTLGGGASGFGAVFKVAAGTNTLTTLANFNGTNGNGPYGGVIADAAGNLYGTTYEGGTSGVGTIFKVATGTNVLTTLASFNGINGANPYSGLIADAAGNLYGTTAWGQGGYGTVFEVTDTGFVVPEPASLALLGIAGSAPLFRRRRCPNRPE
jgi:uncharacterized repeat protein (TIGR03803 family)